MIAGIVSTPKSIPPVSGPTKPSRCQRKHLDLFREMAPDKKIYDLSANPAKRLRTETKDGCLPCLTTSSQFWTHVKHVQLALLMLDLFSDTSTI